MNRHFLIFLSLTLSISTVAAQSKNAPNKNPPAAETAARNLESERLLAERRANAQSLLINLAVDARHFTDDTLRARSLARIADMLWKSDREQSRSLFRSAWDAAETADMKSRDQLMEDIRRQQTRTRGGYSFAEPPSLRREVVGLAARRDRALGEEFLSKYAEQKARETAEEKRASGDDPTKQRLSLAQDMVNEGNFERALQYADPVLGSINMHSVSFLARLRERNAGAADERYAALLGSAQTNSQADANTVSLLASYIFTPSRYVVFFPEGGASGQLGGPTSPANVSAELRAAFFRAATTILQRPLSSAPGQASDAQYLAVKRLLPLFEQFAPAEAVAALRAQLERLGAVASNTARTRNDQFMHSGLDSGPTSADANQATRTENEPNKPPPDREQEYLERRDRARTPAERDRINVQLALLMVDKDDRRAHEYIDKVDDLELRNAARAYVDASIAWNLLSRKDLARVFELVKNGDLTHFQKSWLLSGTAARNDIARSDREQFMALIELAATEARRMETSDPDRPRAFFAIANAVMSVNRSAAWDVMGEAIKAANSADKFTGADGQIAFRLNIEGLNSGHQHLFSDFDVAGIFAKLANEDYDRAVELASGLQNPAPRAHATIAIVKTVSEEKK
jgi:hypothetical protein